MLVISETSPDRALPVLELTADDTRITQSTRIVIPEGLVIDDINGDGVLHVMANDIQLVFAPGSVLRGAPSTETPDHFQGIGVRIDGHTGVQLKNFHVRGFKAGIHASHADELVIEGADVSDNFSQRLSSTPERLDDGADWLGCHNNDANEWVNQYGAGIYVEDSAGVIVSDCFARRTQNGLLLDRVDSSQVYDNDFSFLSGWGLGLWRSSENIISRNSFDFCIRGYSHGRYNRGQDSAGILVFEQCSRNIFYLNSATHGGDGVFGFAGSEALGEREGLPADFDVTRRGNNDNIFYGNDLSYAAAHGLEMTFCFGNLVTKNLFSGNGICGIWGGYSQQMEIWDNDFESNGDAGYGLERGGINIEHSVSNRIRANRFRDNECGVHLWWDPDEGLLKTPWAQVNSTACEKNIIVNNRFERDIIAVELRTCQPVAMAENEMVDVKTEIKAEDGATTEQRPPLPPLPSFDTQSMPGKRDPIGARKSLAGRKNIVLGPWGPWDHEAPFLQEVQATGEQHLYALHNFKQDVEVTLVGEGVAMRVEPGTPSRIVLTATGPGVFPYDLTVNGKLTHSVIQNVLWEVRAFPVAIDPREDIEGWRAAASAQTETVQRTLELDYASAGPRQIGLPFPEGGSNDHFGTLAHTEVVLAPGKYRLKTLSDDGIRVWVDDELLIDNWTWHAPVEDHAEFELDAAQAVKLRVEHFELDGYSVLRVALEPLP
ncbi:MAG: nitrous oxidase accessory protein NosD [Candidatus Paceibacteria bacterium]|jgi:nitrous oxidase accessory protein NosD